MQGQCNLNRCTQMSFYNDNNKIEDFEFAAIELERRIKVDGGCDVREVLE